MVEKPLCVLTITRFPLENREMGGGLILNFDKLILYAIMDSSLWFDTIILEWSILYIEGSQVKMLLYIFSFSEDGFCISKHCIP